VTPRRGAEPASVVVLASSNPAVRRRWREALGDGVRDVDSPQRLGREIADSHARLVLLDLAFGLRGGAAGIAALVAAQPSCVVIAATARPTESEGVAVLRAGARGYCDRDLDPALLRKAVEVVQRGEVWASRVLIARLVEELAAAITRPATAASPAGVRLDALTAREQQIALLVGAGAANKEIGHRLGVTERTVKAHLTAIFRKLGVTDRLRLALALNGAAPRSLPALDA
jgi:DNA-binding NarL/FixJ family response regulator